MLTLRIEAVNSTLAHETRDYILTYFHKMDQEPEDELHLLRVLHDIGAGLDWVLGCYLGDPEALVNITIGTDWDANTSPYTTFLVWRAGDEELEEDIQETRIN